MKENRKKKAVKNILYSFLVKLLTFAIGIVIPRLIIVGYGSEINGLLQTVSNIYSYLALIMAGVGTAAIQGLYKPLSEKDQSAVSSVLVATRQYFRKLVHWYAIGAVIFAFGFSLFVQATVDSRIVIAVILIEGLSSSLTYYYTYTVQSLLSADGRDYVIQIIQFIVFLITSAVKIGLILLSVNIVILEIAYLVINILQITMYQQYIRKQYKWIDWNEKPNTKVLKNRKHFLLNGVAWTVFSSTDTIIISTFCGLMFSSVYALYNMIFANLNLVLAIIYNSVYFILGQVYHEDKEKYLVLHDGFESLITGFVFALLSVTYILILPFFRLYTHGITDINYIDPYLPFLFCMVQILSNCRMISGNLINLTNNPKMTNKASIVEVIINLSLSILLAKWIGLYGVLIATVVALSFKTNYIICISNLKLLARKPFRTYKTIAVNSALFLGCMIFQKIVDLGITDYVSFLVKAILITVVVCLIYLAVNIMANYSATKLCLCSVMKKKDKKRALEIE